MNCQRCGTLVAEGASHCHSCGTPLQQFGNTQQYGHQDYNQQQFGQYHSSANVDMSDLNIGLKIVSLLFWVVGVIMYFVWKDKAPVKAKSALTWGLVGLGCDIIFGILF